MAGVVVVNTPGVVIKDSSTERSVSVKDGGVAPTAEDSALVVTVSPTSSEAPQQVALNQHDATYSILKEILLEQRRIRALLELVTEETVKEEDIEL